MGVRQTVGVITCNLGGMDQELEHVEQSVACDFYKFNDKNFPLRTKAMTPRLQAKIPKCFGWQLCPGHEVYLWLDANIRLANEFSVKHYLDNLEGYDFVVLKHPTHDTVHWEYRYNWRGLHNNAPSNYLCERYTDEWLDEQYRLIKNDKQYKDDLMVNGGIFMYRNTPNVRKTLKDWWYHITRYCIMDQLSWVYVLKKSGLKVKVLPEVFNDCVWLENRRHSKHQ